MPGRYSLRGTTARKDFHSPAAIQKRAKHRDKRVRRLQNGLVSLRHTPEHLVPTLVTL
jgi:hypothetical protein